MITGKGAATGKAPRTWYVESNGICAQQNRAELKTGWDTLSRNGSEGRNPEEALGTPKKTSSSTTYLEESKLLLLKKGD
jgi:hypothetical protein